MYVITGITGQIGGVIGRALLEAKQSVRAVVRNADKGREWHDRGCELALAAIEDASSLADSIKEIALILRRLRQLKNVVRLRPSRFLIGHARAFGGGKLIRHNQRKPSAAEKVARRLRENGGAFKGLPPSP